jgi:phenylacetate-CoA ligase
MKTYFEKDKETMSSDERRVYYDKNITAIVDYAYKKSPFIKEQFDAVGLKPNEIKGTDDLPKAPVIKKEKIREAHRFFPPFGNLVTVPWEGLQRIYISPGPIYDPERLGEKRMKETKALYSIGFRKGDRVIVTLSFHLVPAGLLFDTVLRQLGAIVIPTGVGNTELQVGIIKDLQVTGYIGTATFLMNILMKAEEMGFPFEEKTFLAKALLTAEKVPKSLRKTFEEEYGITTGEGYGTAEIGMFAYECREKSGMHVAEEVFVEIVDPQTGAMVPDGDVGEIVVTHLSRVFPLIRFGTGDLSYLLTESCPCGRTSVRLGEIVGRVGDSFKARGMFLHEPQVKEVVTKVDGIAKGILVVTRRDLRDELTFKIELNDESIKKEEISRSLESTFKDICRLKIDEIEFCPKGTIDANEKALRDERKWD